MPFLPRALEPGEAGRELRSCLAAWLPGRRLEVRAIRLLRHKPGRRCLIQYDLEVTGGAARTQVTLLGKARAKGLDSRTLDIMRALYQGSFGPGSPDGIMVPEPVGAVPEFRMWLQCKVNGAPSAGLLAGPGGTAVARAIAEVARKVHHAGLQPSRRHTLGDEMLILQERLARAARLRPSLAARIQGLCESCAAHTASLIDLPLCGIHRDFYADQVLAAGQEGSPGARSLYVLDFDLYCEGSPALDAGNFLGHITEHSLRFFNDPLALADREAALLERFVELTGEAARPLTQTYAILTLARHVYLSTQFPDRHWTTAPLLELCEQRLSRHV